MSSQKIKSKNCAPPTLSLFLGKFLKMFYILIKEGEEIHIIMEMKDQTSHFLTVLSLFTMGLNEKTLKKTLWPLCIDARASLRRQVTFPNKFPEIPRTHLLILSTLKGWKNELTLQSPSGFEHGTPKLGIQCLNH